MDHALQRIDEIIEERSLLKHPFYRMWSDGKLTRESLAGYSKEYFQLVKAVPSLMDPLVSESPDAERAELAANRLEEQEHVEPWKGFAAALGVSGSELESYGGLPETRRAIGSLFSLVSDYGGGACAMYALEKEIPSISRTKLDGLSEFYGIADEEATRYFELHTEADVRHAAAWQRIVEESGSDPDRLAAIAADSMSAQNLLLDGCYRAYC